MIKANGTTPSINSSQSGQKKSKSLYGSAQSKVAANLKSQQNSKNLYAKIAATQNMVAMASAHAQQPRLLQSTMTSQSSKFITPSKNLLATIQNKSGMSANKTATTSQSKSFMNEKTPNKQVQEPKFNQSLLTPVRQEAKIKKTRPATAQKPKVAQEKVDAILGAIKQKYSKNSLPFLNQKQLEKAIKNEILNQTEKPAIISRSTANFGQNGISQSGPIENLVSNSTDLKHDRSQQLMSAARSNRNGQQNQKHSKSAAGISKLKSSKNSGKKTPQIVTFKNPVNDFLKDNDGGSVSPKRFKGILLDGPVNNMSEAQLGRALAHEVYLDEVINMVDAGSKQSPNKVKPGQMNVFNMKGVNQKLKKEDLDELQKEKQNRDENKNVRDFSTLENLLEISKEENGKSGIKNQIIRTKTEEVQKEFEALMKEMVERRNNDDMPTLEDIIEDFADEEFQGKHKSPTRRLMNHKESTVEHKKIFYNKFNRGEYSQTYCIAPGKSYVIEAQGGELPYELAEQSPSKFYSKVLNQDIKKVKVGMTGKLIQRMTKRALLRIMHTVKQKVIQRISKIIGTQFQNDIANAMAPGSELENKLLIMVEREDLGLANQDGESVNIEIDNADNELKVKEQQSLHELQSDVIKFVKQNSILKEAKEIKY